MTDNQIIIDKKCPIAEKCKEFENCKIQNILQQLYQLKSDNKHLNGLLDQALKELEEHRETLEKVKEIANRPYLLPCGGDCKQQNCTDKTTENGKHCMELKLMQILQICDEVNKDEYDDLSGHWLFDKE